MAPVSLRTVRHLRETFKAEHVDNALGWLSTYGDEPWHREVDRVHRAIVKLSEGHLNNLRHYVKVADEDYRDVLWWSDEPPEHEADPKE